MPSELPTFALPHTYQFWEETAMDNALANASNASILDDRGATTMDSYFDHALMRALDDVAGSPHPRDASPLSLLAADEDAYGSRLIPDDARWFLALVESRPPTPPKPWPYVTIEDDASLDHYFFDTPESEPEQVQGTTSSMTPSSMPEPMTPSLSVVGSAHLIGDEDCSSSQAASQASPSPVWDREASVYNAWSAAIRDNQDDCHITAEGYDHSRLQESTEEEAELSCHWCLHRGAKWHPHAAPVQLQQRSAGEPSSASSTSPSPSFPTENSPTPVLPIMPPQSNGDTQSSETALSSDSSSTPSPLSPSSILRSLFDGDLTDLSDDSDTSDTDAVGSFSMGADNSSPAASSSAGSTSPCGTVSSPWPQNSLAHSLVRSTQLGLKLRNPTQISLPDSDGCDSGSDENTESDNNEDEYCERPSSNSHLQGHRQSVLDAGKGRLAD